MSKTIRIRTNVGNDNAINTIDQTDKNIKVKLEQNFDFLEILSLSITQEEVYRRFCSDYGVVVGRVVVNNGFGVPNAKLSIFIPITDDDSLNEEIRDLYPFEVVTDRDRDGVRYNLLPKKQQNDCHTPIGTIPSKREFQDNDLMLEIYEKYYKFTTTTNESGDFMIFGVPLGSQILHMDVDISDIGILSQRPYDFIEQGTPEKKFDSPTKFKAGRNLDNLVQIKTVNKGVNVIPFWGDPDNCEIGITRVDIDLNYNLTPSALFVGSIFGDSEKNSINKNCRPRKKLGYICDMVSSEGTIEMIRKDLNGRTERFDVQGGRVIDENGAWAYQIPMNLDYVVTDEFGNLVPSEDPAKGIPTKTKVRFKVSMDETGDNGRLRTRAKYLIPHNPSNFNDTDYTFDQRTKDSNFTELYWNKVYSIKNFIPRYQRNQNVNNRNFTGIKNVDDCPSTNNPFPFNKMDTDINPLFSILCVVFNIITLIVGLINSVVVRIINVALVVLNSVLSFICNIVWGFRIFFSDNCKACIRTDCNPNNPSCDCSRPYVDYVPCIVLPCNQQNYAPGCSQSSRGFTAASQSQVIDFHPGNTGTLGAGLADCLSLQLADALNVFELDFYNDWVNGTLYSYLIKYKRKKKGDEKFCDFDCKPQIDPNSVNNCKTTFLIDSCTGNGVNSGTADGINTGLIKKFEDELFYVPYTRINDYKLFATDIITMGSVLECDWQGLPKVIEWFIPTSYTIPPLTSEVDGNTIETSGMNNPGVGQSGLFFNVTCLGLLTNTQNCTNINRISELGVGLDENRTGNAPSFLCPAPGIVNNQIENCDIDNLFIRDVFTDINGTSVNFASTNTNNHAAFGSTVYNNFRGFSNQTVKQPKNSYYFYFGLKPNRTAINKVYSKYFTVCNPIIEDDLIITGIVSNVTVANGLDGSIDITVIGGQTPYTYSWVGTNNFTFNGEDPTNLPAGTYTVTVTDSNGLTGTATFTVNEPFPLSCSVSEIPVTINGGNDGQILVSAVGGGTPPYTVTLVDNITTLLIGSQPIVPPANSALFTNLLASDYLVTVTDSATPQGVCSHIITLNEPTPVVLNSTIVNVTCNGSANGSINNSPTTGGVPPYTFSTVGLVSSTNIILTNLPPGNYTVTATDSIGQTDVQMYVITEPPAITITPTVNDITCNGAGDGSITITPANGVAPYSYQWDDPLGNSIPGNTNNKTNLTLSGDYSIRVTDANGCFRDFQVGLKEPTPLVASLVSVSSYNGFNVSCNGGNDGVITMSASGGNPAPPTNNGGYTYQLYDSANTILITSNGTGIFTTLSADTYFIRVTDVNNCSSNSVQVILNQPNALSVNINTSGSLPNLTLTAVPTGGVSPYTYLWNTAATTQSIIVSSSGTYTVTVTDNNGCQTVQNINV